MLSFFFCTKEDLLIGVQLYEPRVRHIKVDKCAHIHSLTSSLAISSHGPLSLLTLCESWLCMSTYCVYSVLYRNSFFYAMHNYVDYLPTESRTETVLCVVNARDLKSTLVCTLFLFVHPLSRLTPIT